MWLWPRETPGRLVARLVLLRPTTMIHSNFKVWIENEAGEEYNEYEYDTTTPGRIEYAFHYLPCRHLP
jgi:hypothetical protein